jgi:hypothetical protein
MVLFGISNRFRIFRNLSESYSVMSGSLLLFCEIAVSEGCDGSSYGAGLVNPGVGVAVAVMV